ncbi:MAG: hypothetical protein ABMB14_32735, partial [Myxococcota bacterium]
MVRSPLLTALFGLAGGSIVVAIAIVLEIVGRGLPLIGGLITLQRDSVVVWVLESMPFVIGLAGWFLASRTTERRPWARPPPAV